MLIPDVNLLVYACMAGMPQHPKARSFWERALNGDEPVGLLPVVAFGFLRIVTNRKVFTPPLAATAAVDLLEEWLALPSVRLLCPAAEEVQAALALIRAQGTAANLTTDAQIAATALAQGGVVVTSDSDFKRFAKVKTRDPLKG